MCVYDSEVFAPRALVLMPFFSCKKHNRASLCPCAWRRSISDPVTDWYTNTTKRLILIICKPYLWATVFFGILRCCLLFFPQLTIHWRPSGHSPRSRFRSLEFLVIFQSIHHLWFRSHFWLEHFCTSISPDLTNFQQPYWSLASWLTSLKRILGLPRKV